MKKGVIYKITSPSGKIYIGQTKNLNNRTYHYRNESCKKQPKLYNSIKKYGWEVHVFEIIEEIEIDDNYQSKINEREIFWIDFYNSINEGLNIKGGSSNGSLSEDTKKKISEKITQLWTSGEIKGRTGVPATEEEKERNRIAHLGRKHTEESKKKIASYVLTDEQQFAFEQAMLERVGFNHSEETKEKISQAHNGKLLSDEHKQKLSKSHLGKKLSEEHRKKMKLNASKHNTRAVLCLTNGIIYESAYEAERLLHLTPRKVCEVCKGKRKHVKGFMFEYV